MAPPKQLKYTKDEKVLCKHGPCVYPAKILEIDVETNQYKVHYQGWNPKWDEMVDEDRLSKYTEEDAKIAAAENKKLLESTKKRKHVATSSKSKTGLDASHSGEPTGPISTDSNKESPVSRASTPSAEVVGSVRKTITKLGRPPSAAVQERDSSSPHSQEPKRKRNRPSDATTSLTPTSAASVAPAPEVESETTFQNRREIRIKLPDELRPLLVDDWDLITKQMKLVRLPASPTVAEILNDYVNDKRGAKNFSPQKLSQVFEITQGIRSYFDVMLGTQLLYKFERPQFTTVLKNPELEGKKTSEIYGFIHLLRLFVKFGQMLSYTPLDEKSVTLILSHLTDFLKFLKKLKPKDLSNDYETASPEYQRLAYS